MMSKLLINHCLTSQTSPQPNLKLLVSPRAACSWTAISFKPKRLIWSWMHGGLLQDSSLLHDRLIPKLGVRVGAYGRCASTRSSCGTTTGATARATLRASDGTMGRRSATSPLALPNPFALIPTPAPLTSARLAAAPMRSRRLEPQRQLICITGGAGMPVCQRQHRSGVLARTPAGTPSHLRKQRRLPMEAVRMPALPLQAPPARRLRAARRPPLCQRMR